MATIVGAVASSHTPTIGFAYDRNKQDDPVWAPIFEAFRPIREWFARKKPDVLLFVFNDHVTSFFFDHYSAFALGIGESYPVADEGGGACRNVPGGARHAVAGEGELAGHHRHLATSSRRTSPVGVNCRASSATGPCRSRSTSSS